MQCHSLLMEHHFIVTYINDIISIGHYLTEHDATIREAVTYDINMDTRVTQHAVPIRSSIQFQNNHQIAFELLPNASSSSVSDSKLGKYKSARITIRAPAFMEALAVYRTFRREIQKWSDDLRQISCCIYEATNWSVYSRQTLRPDATIYLEDEFKARILQRVEKFYDEAEDYSAFGIAHNLVYLFQGAKSTGRTTMTLHLASHFKHKIYIMNHHQTWSDALLESAVCSIMSDAILVIQDLDLMLGCDVRYPPCFSAQTLVQVLQGLEHRHNLLVIITTSHKERLVAAFNEAELDLASLVDEVVTFNEPTMANVASMLRHFFPDQSADYEAIQQALTKNRGHRRLYLEPIRKFFFQHRKAERILDLIPEFLNRQAAFASNNNEAIYF